MPAGARALGTILILAVGAAACGGSSSPLGPTPAPQACRTYATEWLSTPTFGPPVSHAASFETSSRAYVETSPAGSSQVVRRTTYASVADFIDEPGIFGRVLYVRRESCVGINCSGGFVQVETPAYDRQRRLTGLTLDLRGTLISTETYDTWDSQGRPTAGRRVQPGLCVLPISLSYDDGARTVSVSPVGSGSGVLCLGILYTTRQGYDADGNLVSDDGAAGGTGTTTTNTITATARLCK